jgi:hypothetical protein
MTPTNYEELTVPELKDLAEKRGIEILYDARKAEIIAALEASDLLLHPPPENEQAKSEDTPTQPEEKEGKSTYNYTMSSTVGDVPLSPEEYERLKLHS